MQWSRVRRNQGVIRSRKSKTDRKCNGLELQDTKGVIRSRKSQDRHYNGLELEDAKGVIRSRKSKKDRQYNGLGLEKFQRGHQKP